jgi:hypothetical protein
MMAATTDQPKTSDGKINDFIDGKLRSDSITEQVRQDFERTLIEEYRYKRPDIGVDIRINVQDGTRTVQKKASLVIFQPDKAEKDMNSADVIIQVVKPGIQTTDLKIGTDELERILIACPNAGLVVGLMARKLSTYRKRNRNSTLRFSRLTTSPARVRMMLLFSQLTGRDFELQPATISYLLSNAATTLSMPTKEVLRNRFSGSF